MTQIETISIPKPCHEQWQQMKPKDHGRHCESCCKTVVDFTTMANNEIITYLSQKTDLCGRFSDEQLVKINQQLKFERLQEKRIWSKWIMAAALAGLTLFNKANAQSVPTQTTEQSDAGKIVPKSFPLGKIAIPVQSKYRRITGCVRDENNEVIPGAQITILSTKITAVTDVNGTFNLNVPVSATQFTVNYIGYVGTILNINSNENAECHITLRPVLLGEITIIKPPLLKRIYYKCIKNPVSKIFR